MDIPRTNAIVQTRAGDFLFPVRHQLWIFEEQRFRSSILLIDCMNPSSYLCAGKPHRLMQSGTDCNNTLEEVSGPKVLSRRFACRSIPWLLSGGSARWKIDFLKLVLQARDATHKGAGVRVNAEPGTGFLLSVKDHIE